MWLVTVVLTALNGVVLQFIFFSFCNFSTVFFCFSSSFIYIFYNEAKV